jgi:RNA-directed DNA polymerase
MELLEGKMKQTLSCGNVSTKLQRIAQLAKQHPERSFTAINYVIDIELLKEAYHRTRKDGAVGVDEQTAEQYASELESNLGSLLNRFKDGTYQAPPVKRVYIPKGGGKGLRPIGIPTFEDKILQRAVSMVLEAIYEQDFLGCSYGFRPNRNAHQALEAIWKILMAGFMGVHASGGSVFNSL